MIYIWLNIWPIVAATLTALAIGALWVRASGLQVGPGMAVVGAVAIFWLAAILAGAVILAPPQGDVWTMALGSAFIIWIGFVAPALIVTLGAHDMAWRSIASACAYWLVAMLAQAAVLRAIGVVAPPV